MLIYDQSSYFGTQEWYTYEYGGFTDRGCMNAPPPPPRVRRLERDAWSMVKLLLIRQATTDYAPPAAQEAVT